MLTAILVSLSIDARATEYRVATGGQVDAEFHGMFDFAVRDELWEVSLFTDTLDARWTPSSDSGKAWLGARIEAFAAGLQISPWTDGRPDPRRALISGYPGIEAGVQRYGRGGLYWGIEGHARAYGFAALPETRVDVPGVQPVVHMDGVLGWYRDFASASLRPGFDLAPASPESVFQPHLNAQVRVLPDWTIGPLIEVRAGWAAGQDDVTKTRLGGLNPYVVPLAGAVWAEWWVEDYAAVRGGPAVHVGPMNLGLFADLAWFDADLAAGFGGSALLRHKRFYTQLDGGLAPWIPRPTGRSRVSVWYAIGLDWG